MLAQMSMPYQSTWRPSRLNVNNQSRRGQSAVQCNSDRGLKYVVAAVRGALAHPNIYVSYRGPSPDRGCYRWAGSTWRPSRLNVNNQSPTWPDAHVVTGEGQTNGTSDVMMEHAHGTDDEQMYYGGVERLRIYTVTRGLPAKTIRALTGTGHFGSTLASEALDPCRRLRSTRGETRHAHARVFVRAR